MDKRLKWCSQVVVLFVVLLVGAWTAQASEYRILLQTASGAISVLANHPSGEVYSTQVRAFEGGGYLNVFGRFLYCGSSSRAYSPILAWFKGAAGEYLHVPERGEDFTIDLGQKAPGQSNFRTIWRSTISAENVHLHLVNSPLMPVESAQFLFQSQDGRSFVQIGQRRLHRFPGEPSEVASVELRIAQDALTLLP